jgi:signal transduction histidine kinase/ActR/RegA family two-component response regulator
MKESQDLLEYVITVSRQMAETHNLDALLPFVMDEVLQLVGAEHGYIVLIDEIGRLDFKAKRHHVSTWHGDDEMSHSILQVVVEQGEPLVLGNAMMDPRFAQAKSVMSQNLRSVMCVPLITQERTIGAIYVENRSVEGLFMPENVKPLMLFANQAAASIENARLYGNLEDLVASRTKEFEQAKTRAEAASQAKTVFLTNMSHELRTPLNSILGYAQILRRQLDNEALLADGLTTIYGSGRHLLTLIEDLLDIAKIEANKLSLVPAPLTLSKFLNEIVNIMEMAAREKGLRLVYDYTADLPDAVLVDAKRLRQVLLNLLGNGVKFTDKGQVSLTVSRMASETADPDLVTLHFLVADTGIGINEQDLKAIFTPFEQVSSGQAGGTGLGLSISQEIINLMGGVIEAESQPGTGSSFWFTITIPGAKLPKDKNKSDDENITGYEGVNRRLLIADDKRDNRLVLSSMLEPLGFEVILAENGEEAVTIAQKFSPDLILMDLIMPVMTGFEAISEIRAIPTLADVPIIAVSASNMGMDQQHSQRVGCNEFLPKPISKASLLEILQKLLDLEWITKPLPVVEALSDGPKDDRPIFPPPAVDIKTLHDLARLGDIIGLQGHLKRLDDKSEKNLPFSNQIRYYAETYNFEQIKTFLETFFAE